MALGVAVFFGMIGVTVFGLALHAELLRDEQGVGRVVEGTPVRSACVGRKPDDRKPDDRPRGAARRDPAAACFCWRRCWRSPAARSARTISMPQARAEGRRSAFIEAQATRRSSPISPPPAHDWWEAVPGSGARSADRRRLRLQYQHHPPGGGQSPPARGVCWPSSAPGCFRRPRCLGRGHPRPRRRRQSRHGRRFASVSDGRLGNGDRHGHRHDRNGLDRHRHRAPGRPARAPAPEP